LADKFAKWEADLVNVTADEDKLLLSPPEGEKKIAVNYVNKKGERVADDGRFAHLTQIAPKVGAKHPKLSYAARTGTLTPEMTRYWGEIPPKVNIPLAGTPLAEDALGGASEEEPTEDASTTQGVNTAAVDKKTTLTSAKGPSGITPRKAPRKAKGKSAAAEVVPRETRSRSNKPKALSAEAEVISVSQTGEAKAQPFTAAVLTLKSELAGPLCFSAFHGDATCACR